MHACWPSARCPSLLLPSDLIPFFSARQNVHQNQTKKTTPQARNKPADGSGHIANANKGQRERTPSGQKGGAPQKATAHGAKQPAPGKQQSGGAHQHQSQLSKHSSQQSIYAAGQKAAAAAAVATASSAPKPASKTQKKKKKNTQYDLTVKIDLVSALWWEWWTKFGIQFNLY